MFGMIVFIVEATILCVLFTILVLLSMKNPIKKQIYSYPPNIINRVADMGLIEKPESH